MMSLPIFQKYVGVEYIVETIRTYIYISESNEVRLSQMFDFILENESRIVTRVIFINYFNILKLLLKLYISSNRAH